MFAGEYGWSVAKIVSHTYFQIKSLGSAIAERTYLNRAIQANLIRVANHAKKNDYERYLDTLKPSQDNPLRTRGKRSRVGGEDSVPKGFAYSKRKRE